METQPLGKEYAYFNSILPKLMKESYGKFAVISGETLLNIYDTREEARKGLSKALTIY